MIANYPYCRALQKAIPERVFISMGRVLPQYFLLVKMTKIPGTCNSLQKVSENTYKPPIDIYNQHAIGYHLTFNGDSLCI